MASRIVKVIDFSRAAEESRRKKEAFRAYKQAMEENVQRMERLEDEFRFLIERAEKVDKVGFLALKAGNSPLSERLLRELTMALEHVSPGAGKN